MSTSFEYDAVVVGSGPNGLAAAITMQRAGLSVLVLEAKETIGGGTRSAELTLPGFTHDICSAIHPLGYDSPFFKTLPLQEHGLEYLFSPLAAAHPFANGTAAVLTNQIDLTASAFGSDQNAYVELMRPLVKSWPILAPDIIGPLQFPHHPITVGAFGKHALQSAERFANQFKSMEARGFIAGMAAHAIQPLTNLATAAFALVLMITGHSKGWPIAKGGSQSIANALASYFTALGGKIVTHHTVRSMGDLPSARAILFDTTPKQLVDIAGSQLSSIYKWRLKRYKYGMGVFKIDWALSAPIPFTAAGCREAATVHLGNSFEEIAGYESDTSQGKTNDKPFVLLAQQSQFDRSRAPVGKQTAWAYCHVPNGSTMDMTHAIEQQVERFAPGFKDLILARHTMNTSEIEQYNANYIGGDINGGVIDITQLFTRPVASWSPYRTSAKNIYLCSSSTPPGGGVHGMCGYYAAKRALKDVFGLQETVGLSKVPLLR